MQKNITVSTQELNGKNVINLKEVALFCKKMGPVTFVVAGDVATTDKNLVINFNQKSFDDLLPAETDCEISITTEKFVIKLPKEFYLRPDSGLILAKIVTFLAKLIFSPKAKIIEVG